jgi:hypothetical protein
LLGEAVFLAACFQNLTENPAGKNPVRQRKEIKERIGSYDPAESKADYK